MEYCFLEFNIKSAQNQWCYRARAVVDSFPASSMLRGTEIKWSWYLGVSQSSRGAGISFRRRLLYESLHTLFVWQRWNHDTSTTNIKLIDQNESLALSTNENDCFIELIAYILRKCGQKDWKVTNLWKLGTNSDTKWISNASDVRECAIHGPQVWLKRTLNMYVNAVLSTSIERSFHS